MVFKQSQDLRDDFTPDVETDSNESSIVLLEKPPNTLYDFGDQNTDEQEEIEQEKESFE